MRRPNPVLKETAVMLERAGRDQKAPIWMAASRALSRTAVNKVEVNLGRVSRLAKEGEAVFVPGKVLGLGTVDKGVIVGAFSFSESARAKITSSGGMALGVKEFMEKYPKGSGVKLVE